MKTSIIRIGNSWGVRIPGPILKQCGLKGHVEMNVKDNALVITPVREARSGWSDAFKSMAERGDDAPLLNENDLSGQDENEWLW